MRNELNNIERIERYLAGKMNKAEHAAFEQEMAGNPAIQNEMLLQRQVVKGIERRAIKQTAKKAYRKYTFGKQSLKWGGITGGALILAAAAFLTWNHYSGTAAKNGFDLPQLNENGEKLWADADKYLPGQHFIINTGRDTVIETADGIVMAIPANCFLTTGGKPATGTIDVEVKEALKTADIMRAGLSTKSGEQLLETGGMFYLNARQNDASLTIDPTKGVYTEIPTDEVKAGMQLYEGKRLANGSIDWVNPKPMEKFLVPVDINSLSFYPPNYEDTLAGMGKDVSNKIYKDSLYYSFAHLFDNTPQPNNAVQGVLRDETDSLPKKVYNLPYDYYIKNKPLGMHYRYGKGILQTGSGGMSVTEFDRFVVFAKQHGFIYSYNSYQGAFNKTMYSFAAYKKYSDAKDETPAIQGINPSKIKAIWNSQFNNTILATREFEQRIPLIHQTCNSAVLDVYVNNLDKKLCTLDSMAAQLAGGYRDAFMDFARRGDGRVDNNNPQLEKLQAYYAAKTKAFTEAAAKTEKEFWERHNRAQEKFSAAESAHKASDRQREQDIFWEEYAVNLKDAYRQLGYVPGKTYAAVVGSTGWKNVDRAVYESTLARETLDYTDPITGRKAVIKYEPVSITVKEYTQYDALFVYLVPDQLSSFMRIDGKNGVFNEKLDELMTYEMVCVAYKGKQAYLHYTGNIQPGEYSNITLTAVSKQELDNRLKLVKKSGHEQKLAEEIAFRHIQREEAVRLKKVTGTLALRDRIKLVIFPCSGTRPTQKLTRENPPQVTRVGFLFNN